MLVFFPIVSPPRPVDGAAAAVVVVVVVIEEADEDDGEATPGEVTAWDNCGRGG